jgi:hypothetical protein
VQDHRIHGDELLALQAVDDEIRRLREVELGELRGDGVEPLHRAPVIVLVVARQQLLGKAVDVLGVERHGLDLVGHGLRPLLYGLGKGGFAQRARRGRARDQCRAADEVASINPVSHILLLRCFVETSRIRA